MAGVKGKSGGARETAGRRAGGVNTKFKGTDGRVKIQPMICTDTFELLRIRAAQQSTGKGKARASALASEILDSHVKEENTPEGAGSAHRGDLTLMKKIPALYEGRRLQISLRVMKETKIFFMTRSVEDDISVSCAAAAVLDLWAKREQKATLARAEKVWKGSEKDA